MPGGSRSLPGHPSLRHLKLEAKRRLAAGEFPTLHDAQVAIAREHGLPTWAALKQRVSDIPDSHAYPPLDHRRFQAADQPGWQPRKTTSSTSTSTSTSWPRSRRPP